MTEKVSGKAPHRREEPITAVRILVVDDHSIVRRGVRALLEGHRRWEVCGEAATGADAVAEAKRLKPDVVVMDISMPGMSGLEATRQITKALPNTDVLILTIHESEEVLKEVLDAGARGYVFKSDLDSNLVAAVGALHQGRMFFSSPMSELVLEGYLKGSQPPGKDHAPPGRPLTDRQRQIVRSLALGKTNKEVAVILGISVKTVETHRNRIMHRLGLDSFSGLVRYAVRHKIIEL